MDSFCWPSAPCPTRKPNLEPMVPDVSLLFHPPNTYNSWKNNIQKTEKENMNRTSSKKHVRFNSSPDIEQQLILKVDQPQHTSVDNHSCNKILSKEVSTPPMNKVFKNKQFQEVYMANIPNRQLDLSLLIQPNEIEAPKDTGVMNNRREQDSVCEKPPLPPRKMPTTYKEFLELHKGNEVDNLDKSVTRAAECVTDIFNYSSPRVRNVKNKVVNYKKNIENSENNKGSHSTQNSKEIKMNSSYNHSKPEKFSSSATANLAIDSPKHYQINSHQLFSKDMMSTQSMSEKHTTNQPFFTEDSKCREVQGTQMCSKNTCDSSIQTSFAEPVKKVPSLELMRSDEPTVKDLLKIIQQQNEQLLLLQKQVSSLLDYKDNQKSIEAADHRFNVGQEHYYNNREKAEILNSVGSTPRKGPLPKFSIDLMTSFEVSIRPQQNMYQRKPRDYMMNEPKIQEIIETDCKSEDQAKRINDTSLQLQNPISVRENCPSPEPSIKIDMKEYESSEDDDDDVEATSSIGTSFYKNLMNQVNKIIQNAQKQSNGDMFPSKNEELRDKTMSRVTNATIKHLRKIGVNFSTINESNNSDISNDSTSEQISFAVKQLLMKYLPDEQLAKLTIENSVPKKDNGDKIVLNSRAPEFSFATLKFMKKYNLISGGSDVPTKENIPVRAIPSKKFRGLIDNNNPKILDISALKQQPKLL